MRILHIGETGWPLSNATAKVLLRKDLVYVCGKEHDLHLSPDGPKDAGWTLADVEALVEAVRMDMLPLNPARTSN